MNNRDILKFMIDSDKNLNLESFNSLAFSEPDVYYRVDMWIQLYDWSKTKDNVLFITGLSGGGKGYRAKKMAEEYSKMGEVIIVELDKFENYTWYQDEVEDNEYVAEGDRLIFDYLKKLYPDGLDIDHWITNIDRYRQDLRSFMFYLMDYAEKRPKTRFIVEGVQIFFDDFFVDDILLDREHNCCSRPIIVIQTSRVKSMTKVMHRKHNQIRNRLHSKDAGPSTLKEFLKKLNLDRQEYYSFS